MASPIIPEHRKFSPYFVFFIISSMQIGIGMFGYQRIIAKVAGQDSWLSVIFAGITTNILMWIMYKLLEESNGDLTDIHLSVFGKWVGKIFDVLFILYFSLYVVTVLRTYIEIIQVCMFPDLSTFWFGLLYLLLCIYIIYGGLRTVIGIAFFSFFLPSYVIIFFGYAIHFANFGHFFPVFNHSAKEILEASQNMSLSSIGYETILIFYPYIKNPEKSKKWAQLSLVYTTLIYLFICLVTIGFYPLGYLSKNIWGTLTIFKIVHFPIVERAEYIGIANCCLLVLPNVTISLWCASRILKRALKVKMKYGSIVLGLLTLISSVPLRDRFSIDLLNSITANFGFLINYIYVPILFLFFIITKKVKKFKF
ncbi:MAG: GerAB/ArcD/ProY family transporter [Heyndrickxia sp.]